MSCFSQFFEFYAGEDKDLSMTLNTQDKTNDCREPFDLTGASQIQVEIPASPNNIIFNGSDVTVVSPVKAEIKISLTASHTAQMINGAVVVTVTKDNKKKIFVANGAIRKQLISNC